MTNFHYETDFRLIEAKNHKDWIEKCCKSEGYVVESLNYIFCDDDFLLKINQEYLNHDNYTDIITFDYTQGKLVSGDIYISVERVRENSKHFDVSFENELHRVMAHGLLHLMGYKDKGDEHIELMRQKEEEKIKLFHVEQ